MASFVRPRLRLDDEAPVVGSESDIDLAFAELSWIDTRLIVVTAELNAELDSIRKRFAAKFLVNDDGDQLLVKRREAIETAVRDFARSNKESLLAGLGEKKTRQFGLGTIGFKLSSEAVMPRHSDADLASCLSALLDRFQIREKLTSWLNDFVHVGLPLGSLLRWSLDWDAAAIKKAFAEKRITAEQLAEIGLKVDRDEERIEVKLK